MIIHNHEGPSGIFLWDIRASSHAFGHVDQGRHVDGLRLAPQPQAALDELLRQGEMFRYLYRSWYYHLDNNYYCYYISLLHYDDDDDDDEEEEEEDVDGLSQQYRIATPGWDAFDAPFRF